ncbi:MAG TPA: FGGY family carbohydrate kinase [Spongiibacteraceae bacterium]|nr:FGGY family carbohydrate kinase [Spongiibacteraceae bacterium]
MEVDVKEAWYLCLDQGGSSSRALVIDAGGRVRSRGQCPVATAHPRPGWVEQSPGALLRSVREAASQALAALAPAERCRIVSAGLVTQRSSLLGWHPQTARPATPVLSWQDTRGAALLEQRVADPEVVLARTGLWPNAHFGASKFAWCLREWPALRSAAQRGELCLGPLAAWLAQALTLPRGQDPAQNRAGAQPPRVDIASAQRTLLLDHQRGDWCEVLCARFGLDPRWLPQVVDSDAGFGRLALDALDVPLQVLGGDQGAALFADGEPDPDSLYINLGTGAFLMRPLKQAATAAPVDPGRQLLSLNWQRGGRRWRTLEGTVNGAGAALDWWSRRHGGRDYRGLLAQALGAAEPPLFFNAVGGLGSPDWRADLAPRFAQGGGEPLAELAGVVESIVYLIRRNAAQLAPYQRLRVSGGLANSDALCQRLADALAAPVLRSAEPEATARGLQWWLAAAAGRGADGEDRTPQSASAGPDTARRFVPSGTAEDARYALWTDYMAAQLAQPPEA